MFNDAAQTVMLARMLDSGMPRAQAVALVCSIEHCLQCPTYKEQFGTYLVGQLQALVDTATEPA